MALTSTSETKESWSIGNTRPEHRFAERMNSVPYADACNIQLDTKSGKQIQSGTS